MSVDLFEGEESVEAGFVRDFISGRVVRSTPEEMEAVQVRARRLVEDLGYPRELITTRPQHRVRRRPSGGGKALSYPADIRRVLRISKTG